MKLVNKDCRFQPHVVAVRPGQKLEVSNDDATAHNSQITPINGRNKAINPQIPPGQSIEYSLQCSGVGADSRDLQ